MDIVDRIKLKCKENRTNISAIEKNLNIGNGVIRRWNERKPGAEQVYKIAIYLNTTVEWLLTGKETANLSVEEQQLIDCYRRSNQNGRELILEQAQSISEKLPAELPSSTSRIGLTAAGES